MTSSTRVLDEAMSAYRPRTTKTGGLEHLSFVKRKPEDLGTEFKCASCPMTRLMTNLEIQRGKFGMLELPLHTQLGATASCVVRIARSVSQSHIDGNNEQVIGDSWFGSVKAVCHLQNSNQFGGKTEAIFQVKTAHTGFPKAYIKEVLEDAPGGTSIVLKATDGSTNTKLVAVGYKYNSKKTLMFIASDGAASTLDGEPYRMRFVDRYGNVVFRDVRRPQLVSIYFSDSNCVDVHNQLRQYCLRLEKNGSLTNLISVCTHL